MKVKELTTDYDFGLFHAVEPDENGHEGWAVFTGVDGEQADFVAYFVDENSAGAYVDRINRTTADVAMVRAVVTPQGIFAEDEGLESYADLRKRVSDFVAKKEQDK